MNITPINGVGKESVIDKLKALFKSVPSLKPSVGLLRHYNQGKDWTCTSFATAGAITYNTGIITTDNAITQWAKDHNWNVLWPLGQVAKVYSEEHWNTCIALNLDSGEAKKILEAGYALIVSTRCPTGFFKAWLTTGDARWKHIGEPFAHAMYIIQNNRHQYIVNSWGKYISQGMYNKYEISLDEMLILWYVRKLCYLCV